MKVLSLFSEYSREFGYRNVEGSKILLSAKPESKIRQEHPGLVHANKDSVLEEVVLLNTDWLKTSPICKVAGHNPPSLDLRLEHSCTLDV